MQLKAKNGSITTAAGSASTTVLLSDYFGTGVPTLLLQVIVTPTTATTAYDIKFIDDLGNNLIDETDRVGTMNESLVVPLLSNFTLSITNASNDEAITYYVAAQN